MTLTEFLLARIAEDEAVARAATPGAWWYDPSKVNSIDREESVFTGERGLKATTVASTGPCDDVASMRDANHIARHNPARVLAECEAKRRIVSLANWEGSKERLREHIFGPMQDYAFQQGIEQAMKSLAEVYADHSDYDESWRP